MEIETISPFKYDPNGLFRFTPALCLHPADAGCGIAGQSTHDGTSFARHMRCILVVPSGASVVAYKSAMDGNSPSYREMMRACRLSSLSVVRRRLCELARTGRIRLLCDGSARSIVVVGGSWSAPNGARRRQRRG